MRSSKHSRMAVVSAVSAMTLLAAGVEAATHTYSPLSDATDQWSAGTNWSTAPVSGDSTSLVFVGTNSTALPVAFANTNTNDNAGNFILNSMTLQGTGPSTDKGVAPSIAIAGGTLEFRTNSADSTGPAIVLNANRTNQWNLPPSYSVSSQVLLTDDLAVSGNGTGSFTFSGAVSGDKGIVKSGNSTIGFTGSNTFSGGITLNAGGLALNGAGAGSGKVIVNGGSLLPAVASGATATLTTNNAFDWNGNFSVNGSGNRTLKIGDGNVTLGAANIVIGVAEYTTLHVGGAISGEGKALTLGNGTSKGGVTLAGVNSFTGGVTLASGGLRISNPQALGSGMLTINGGSVSQNVAGAVTGISGQTWAGNFSLECTAGAINLGTSPVALVGDRQISTNNGSATVGGVISGIGSSLTLKGSQYGSTLYLNGANTFGGGVTVTPGSGPVTLGIGSLGTGSDNSAIGTGTLRFATASTGSARIDNTSGAAGTLATNNAQAWDYNFTFVGSNDLNMGTGAVTLGGNRTVTVSAKTLTIGGAIDDGAESYGLTKAGTGTLVLAGANTYGGDTTITAGTLVLDAAGSILLDVNDGSNTAILGSGTADLRGTLVLDVSDVTGSAAWTLVAPDLNDIYGEGFGLMLLGGTEFTASGDLYSATFGGKEWVFDRGTGELNVVVPEPGTMAMLAGVSLLLAGRRRRSR